MNSAESQIFVKIDTFLQKNVGLFEKNYGVDEETVSSVLKELEKRICVSGHKHSLPVEYLHFLKNYGAVFGQGLCIMGCATRGSKEEQCLDMVMEQRGFEVVFKNLIGEDEIKYCWCLGRNDDGYGMQYYLNVSDTGKGHIYCVGYPYGKPKYFASNFSDLVEKFFEIYNGRESVQSDEYRNVYISRY